MARQFDGFKEGQTITDNRTGTSYQLRAIKMRGDGTPLANFMTENGRIDCLPLSRFR